MALCNCSTCAAMKYQGYPSVLTMREDMGQKPKYRQKYDYTSFPLDKIEFYAVHGGLSPEGHLMTILMLPGEY